MADVDIAIATISDELSKLRNEMEIVLSHTKTLWGTDRDWDAKHFPYTLYGFVMCIMSKVDYLSQHWLRAEKPQTKRMVSFLNSFLDYDRKPSEIAVQFFRHNLMHTSTLDQITEKVADGTERKYRWLLHHGVGNDLPRDQHMNLEGGTVSLGAMYLIEDLIAAVPTLVDQLALQPEVGLHWDEDEKNMRIFPKKKRDDPSR